MDGDELQEPTYQWYRSLNSDGSDKEKLLERLIKIMKLQEPTMRTIFSLK